MMSNITKVCHAEFVKSLKEAGYNDQMITAEIEYLERVKFENQLIRTDKNWNYGMYHEV